jgi:hypothetical protein
MIFIHLFHEIMCEPRKVIGLNHGEKVLDRLMEHPLVIFESQDDTLLKT